MRVLICQKTTVDNGFLYIVSVAINTYSFRSHRKPDRTVNNNQQ